MIEGYFGLPGSGKTYFAVQEAHKRLARGEKVFTNFKMEGTEYFQGWEPFFNMSDCCIVIDEAGIWLNARKWSIIPEEILYRLMQSRKRRFDLIYTSQHPEMVEVTLRRITNYFWYMKKFRIPFLHVHRATCWEPEYYRKEKKKPLMSQWFKIKKHIANLYDTEAIIENPHFEKENYTL